MFKGIQFVITFFIVASLILQIVSILGGFSALRNVYILKVKLEPSSTSSGLLNSILGSSSSSILDSEPSFFTAAPFLVCQGSTDGSKNMCSPASFGYKYESTGVLDTFQNLIPDWVHQAITGVQGGIFIPSVCFCFILLIYNLFEYCGRRSANCCKHIMTTLVAGLALIFVIAFFVVQIVLYKVIKNEIEKAKTSLFGSTVSNMVTISTSIGPSAWMVLAAMILLFIVCGLLLLSFCCVPRTNRRNESYEMGPV